MQDKNLILCLFYSDEENHVYDKIKYLDSLSSERKSMFRTLSLRFLGPLLLAEGLIREKGWILNKVESTLTFHKEILESEIIQSFTCLNSTKLFEGNNTNLFVIIGSPYTEDVTLLYQKLIKYIHPIIIQEKIVNESINGNEFDFNKFIDAELTRGINLIEHSLGSARKMYWKKKQNYYCIGIIERIESGDIKVSNLYTFDYDDPLRNIYLSSIPSYYIMAILPDYYEDRIIEALRLFNKTNIHPSIRSIDLSNQNKKVLYLEEFLINNNEKKSYGLILVSSDTKNKNSHDQTFYKQKIRLILDKNKNFEETVIEINPKINPFEKWNLNSTDSLSRIQNVLDIKNKLK
ncbi:MAG: hypothetical protein ACFFD7_05600 [Candidatus Thorarchaeota archaeon]